MSGSSQDIPNQSLDIMEVIKMLWRSKFFIISMTSIFAIFSVFYALSIPNSYQSSSLLEVNNQGGESGSGISSIASQYSGLASIAGISIPSSVLDSGIYATSIIKSREFAKHLMSFDMIKPKLMASKSYDPVSKKIIYDKDIYNINTNLWIREPSGLFQSEPTYLEVHETALKELKVSRDVETGLISISFVHLSPVFAQEIVSLVIKEVNRVTREKKLKESKLALDYLQQELVSINNKDLRFNINNLIQKQLNEKMLASIKEDYLISIIDSPIVPIYKSSPKRARICILITLFGGILSVMISFIRGNIFNKE